MKKVRSKLRPTEIGVIKTFSLSPDDEVGEIAVQCSGCTYYYNNLAELCEKWEDWEEPKYFYCISTDGSINKYEVERYAHDSWCINGAKIIGNYFKTKEEAEKAVEKLRAWKRLKDKGFKFELRPGIARGEIRYYVTEESNEVEQDLQICFGGEE